VRFLPTFSATNLVVAGVVVALFGGFLLIVEQQGSVPGAARGDAGSFSPTGSLALPRTFHSATLLPDSRVLIVGGTIAPGQNSRTAEVWDPGTGAFSPTGSLARPRSEHSATLLPDGRVLVAGGGDRHDVELWDPSTGRFSPAGSHDMDWAGSATLLADGRVLVMGGVYSGGTDRWNNDESLPSAEVWDPATSTFSPTGLVFGGDEVDRPEFDHFIGATLLADGRVLIFGVPDPCDEGEPDDSVPAFVPDRFCIASAEIWDPATGTFSPAGSLPRRDSGITPSFYSVTALADGRALIAGGCGHFDVCADYFPSAEVWDPDTQSFGPAGSLSVTRLGHTATLLNDGRVLVIGGWSPDADADNEEIRASAEVWEPSDR
jgi:WD40 repeat protein